MSDLKKFVTERKKRDREFAEGFDEGYAQFKIGATLRKAREAAGLSQEELAISGLPDTAARVPWRASGRLPRQKEIFTT